MPLFTCFSWRLEPGYNAGLAFIFSRQVLMIANVISDAGRRPWYILA